MAVKKAAGAVTLATLTYGAWIRKNRPLHIVWDLDATLLCSICPIAKAPPGLPKGCFFDQVDDDFPFAPGELNTRTVWRPGARFWLRALDIIAIQHIYTAAQATYTQNILREIERAPCVARGLCPPTPFASVIHRDCELGRDHLQHGKDISHAIGAGDSKLKRALLFDDRVRNFRPQPRNGVHVKAFTATDVEFGGDKEILRLVGIALLAFFAPDVREVTAWFRTARHDELVRKANPVPGKARSS